MNLLIPYDKFNFLSFCSYKVGSHTIEASWAGGDRGREVPVIAG